MYSIIFYKAKNLNIVIKMEDLSLEHVNGVATVLISLLWRRKWKMELAHLLEDGG